MKRLLYGSALLLATSFFTGCAQQDTNSPDTSGAMPNNRPDVGVDTIGSQTGTGSPNRTPNDSANGQGGSATDTTGSNNQ